MADEQTPIFNLGIENSAAYGNLQDAESFLSGTDTIIPTGDLEKTEDEIQKLKEKSKEKIISSDEIANNFLNGEEDEEEEKEIPKEKKTLKDAVKEGEDEGVTPFESISSELYKAGIFSVDEGEEEKIAKTPEEFLELFNEQGQRKATGWLENYLARFGEDRRELFDAIYVNGVDPKEYIPIFNEVQDFETLDLEQESNQEKVVRSFLKKSGWADVKIDAKIDKLKSFADLEDEAKTVHPILVEQDKAKLTKLSEDKALEQQNKIAEDTAYKTLISQTLQDKLKDKNFEGIPLTEKQAKEAFDFLYIKKWKTKSGELLTDFDAFILDSKKPDNINARIKIALLAANKFDFSKIEKKAVSKESNALFSTLIQNKTKKSNKQSTVDNSGWQNL